MTDKEEKAKQQTTPESGPNKREVALEKGSLRDLVQERVGDFKLQGVEEVAVEEVSAVFFRGSEPGAASRELILVEALVARYVGPSGASLILITTRSPEAADNLRQQLKAAILTEDD